MQKPFSIILMEAVVVGILLIIVYNIVDLILLSYKLDDKMSLLFYKGLVLFVSGFIFHILCEITGINLWYVKDYNKYIVK
jgi:hypothetical protein